MDRDARYVPRQERPTDGFEAGGAMLGNFDDTIEVQQTTVQKDEEESAQIRRALRLDFDTIYDNALNDYHLPTYHWRLYQTELGILQEIANQPERYQTILDNAYQVTLVESGVTAFSIEDVNIESALAPKENIFLFTSLRVAFEIYEPYGTSFLEKLAVAGVHTGLKSQHEAIYMLELTFYGHDPSDGTPRRLPYRRTWPIKILNIDVPRIEAGGTRYTISANVANHVGIQRHHAVSLQNMSFPAETVGEVLDAVTETLNTRNQKDIGDVFSPNIEYSFVVHQSDHVAKEIGTDPRDWRIVDNTETRPIMSGNFKTLDGKTTLHIGTPTNLAQMLELIFASTEEGQRLIGVSKDFMQTSQRGREEGEQETSDSSSPAATISDKNKTSFSVIRIDPQVVVKDFHAVSGQYNQAIIYHIHFWEFTNLVTDNDYATHALTPEGQKQRWETIKRRVYKTYHYTYTGLNTEILNFEMRINGLYAIAMPYFGGLYNYSLFRDGKWLDPKKYQLINSLKELRQAQDAKRKKETELSAIDARMEARAEKDDAPNRKRAEDFGLSEDPGVEAINQVAIEEEISLRKDLRRQPQLLAEIENVNQQVTTQRVRDIQELSKTIPDSVDEEIDMSHLPDETSKKRAARVTQTRRQRPRYIEDSRGDWSVAQDWHSLANSLRYIRFDEDDRASATNTNLQIEPGRFERGRTLFGALLNQVYQQNAAFMTVELEIRGDPWWLGLDPFQARFIESAGTQPIRKGVYSVGEEYPAPDFLRTAHLFGLTVNFPRGYDETTGVVKETPGSLMEGIYQVLSVRHVFSDGKFTQQIQAARDPLTNAALSEVGRAARENLASTSPSTKTPTI